MASSSPYSPQTQTVLRRSKYLEDALTQMQQTPKITGGWGELAARLGATAILSHGQKKTDRALSEALAQEAKDRAARITAPFDAQAVMAQPVGAPPPPPSPSPIQAASLQGGPQAPQAAPQSAPQAAPASAARLGSSLVAALMPGLIQRETGGRVRPGPMTRYGQANGLTQMLDSTAEAMAKKLGVPWRPDLLRADTKEGRQYQETLGAAYLQEGLDATGNPRDALRYYHGGPDRSIWGPKTNAYADAILAGSPTAQMTGGPAPQGQMQVAPTMAQAQAPQAPQGEMGFPPMPPAAPAPQPQQQAPQGQQWGPSPAEISLVRQLAADPRTQDQAEALAFELRKKYAAPPKMETYSANGVPMAFNPYTAQSGALPVPQGAMNQTVGAGQLGIQAPPGTAYSVDPYGKPTQVFQPQAGQQVASAPGQPYQEAPITGGTGDIRGNPQQRFEALKGVRAEIKPVIDSAIALRRNYSALLAGYAQQNGTGDVAMTNGFQKMIDEGVVREGDVALQLKAQGIEGGLAGLAGYANSDGMYSPAIREKLKLIGDDLYDKISGTYRQRVEGYRVMVDRTFGDGSFADVLPPETAAALGWVDQPQGQGAAQGGQGSGGAPRGAQRAQDGKFYIQDPTKPGSFPEVRKAPDGKWYLKSANGQYLRVD